jgi:hypothetical protein
MTVPHMFALAATGGAAGPPTLPVTANLRGHWDPSDASTITYYTPPRIQQIDDQSGLGHHMQNTLNTTRNPNMASAAIGGLDAVDFVSANNTYLRRSIAATAADGSYSFYCVVSPDAVADLRWVADHTDPAGGATQIAQVMRFNATTAESFSFDTGGGADGDTGGSVAAGVNYVACVIVTASVIEVFIDNASGGSSAITGTLRSSSATPRTFWLGTRHTELTSAAFDGQMGEAVLYNVAHGSTDRTAIHDYLATKWGI